jgi:hypothetical protein
MTCSEVASHEGEHDWADEGSPPSSGQAGPKNLVTDPTPEQHEGDHAEDEHDVRSHIGVRLAVPHPCLQDGHNLWCVRSEQSSIPYDAA